MFKMSMNPKYFPSDSEESDTENTYCIFLHILEGVGLNLKENGDFNRHNQPILLYASLNGVKFEVEGHCRDSSTIFNSNFIWECELKDVKKIKTENRPIKLECFFIQNNSANFTTRQIGTLLLALRNVPILNNLRAMQELIWLKLTGLNAMWRESKPELHLLLAIVKKSLVDNGQIEIFLNKLHFNTFDTFKTAHSSETSSMLQPQECLYVQLLEQEGLIQVGNNIDVDNDIFSVSLTFKQIEGLGPLCDAESATNNFVFSYNFLGSISKFEINANVKDVYSINEKISLSLRSSVKSLRIYFQRVFHIPIRLFHNGILIATYRFDFESLLPDDLYFNVNNIWQKSGSFSLSNKLLHNRNTPVVDYLFTFQLTTRNVHKQNTSLSDISNQGSINEKLTGDLHAHIRHISVMKESKLQATTVNRQNYSTMEEYIIDQSALLALGEYQHEIDNELVFVNSSDEVIKVALTQNSRSIISPRITQESIIICTIEGEEPKHATAPKIFSQDAEVEKQDIGKNKQILDMKSNEILKTGSIATTLNFNWENDFMQDPDHSDLNKASIQDVMEYISPPLISVTSSNEQNKQNVHHGSNNLKNLNNDELNSPVVEELEQWKKDQQLKFLKEMESKEEAYINQLNQKWEKQRYALQIELESKISKCEELNSKLQRAYYELKETNEDNTQVVKNDIEITYAYKIRELDEKMRTLQTDVEQKSKDFEIQNKELQQQNIDLLCENKKLSEQIHQLENRLQTLQSIHAETNAIADLNSQLKDQLKKSKNYYKTQWIKCARELNDLQLSVLQNQPIHETNCTGRNNVIMLKDILGMKDSCLEN